MDILGRFLEKNKDKIATYVDLGLQCQTRSDGRIMRWHKLIVVCGKCFKSQRIEKLHQFKDYRCRVCHFNENKKIIRTEVRKRFINYALSKGFSESEAQDLYISLKNKKISMYSRCYNYAPKNALWFNLPEPKICDEWRLNSLSFYKWCLENGFPKKTSINRLDSKKGYSPGNCELVYTTIENSTENSQYIKDCKVFFYKDCGLYLSLEQRAKWLGYRSRKSLKRTNHINLGELKKGFNPRERDEGYFSQMHHINKSLIEKGIIKLKATIGANQKTMSYKEFAKIK